MEIPVTFTFKGKQVTGILAHVNGAGSTSTFHLYINKYYYGFLHYTDRWVFHAQNEKELEQHSDYFGAVVVAAYEK